MDATNIASELNKLREKSRAINTETDLNKHCDALVELDFKVGSLLDDIRHLQVDVERRFGYMVDVWDQLERPYSTLKRVDEALGLVIELHELNRICKRIDTSPYLSHTADGQLNLKVSSLNQDGEDDENVNGDNDDRVALMMVQGLLDSFESTYSLLADLLSKRLDLPYAVYASKVRTFQKALDMRFNIRSRNKAN